jgi:hypothetical protein
VALSARSIVVLSAGLALLAGSASAQGTYVSASVVTDISRFSRATSEGSPDFSGGGEAIGFALRLGTPVGASWGVEAEFARPSEIQQDDQVDFITLGRSVTFLPSFGELPIDPLVFGYRLKTRQRTTTFSSSVWVRQELSNRLSLVYLGGLGFARTMQSSELMLPPVTTTFPGIPRASLLPPSRTTQAVEYGVHPLAGFEARIGLAGHVELVPGVRLLGLNNGWLVRPSVGLAWTF